MGIFVQIWTVVGYKAISIKVKDRITSFSSRHKQTKKPQKNKPF